MTLAWSDIPAAAETIRISEAPHIHGVSFDPAAPGSILLATHNGLFRASPDGEVQKVSTNADDYMGFSPDPGDAGWLLASGHPARAAIWGGDSLDRWWRYLVQLGRRRVGAGRFPCHGDQSRRSQGYLWLFRGIQASRDEGPTWTMAGPGPEEMIDLAAPASASDTIYAGTAAGLMQSIYAAKSWVLAEPSGAPTAMIEATADGSLYAFFAGAGLFRLLADGTWIELPASFGSHYVLHLATDPDDAAHLVAATKESAVLESRDGGATWENFGQ
ncbi:MAG: hypothetical protein MO852_07425 [Candidatus Devosia euplotis]|nr:hypothetical protein [Candidatus Devosia euplotis]